jgi:hypothetical protein
MFGSKNSGQLRWCLAALAFVWAAAIAGIASAADKVTICHFPPGNPANYQQISIDANGVAAHLAHGDFLGPCASDCNANTTLCNTPPDQCHQVGTCVTSTGLCRFPTQPDRTACTGLNGLSCDSCLDGACVAVSSCPLGPNGAYTYCSPTNGGTCAPATTTSSCSTSTTFNMTTFTNPSPPPPTLPCYVTSLYPPTDTCIQSCGATVCGDNSPTVCGQAVGCVTNADCPPQTIDGTGLPNKCVTGSCQNSVCAWADTGFFCNLANTGPGTPVGGCDPEYGCYTFIPPQ